MMKRTNWLVATTFSLLLTGCFEGNLTTEELCEKNPELRCEQLNMSDGQCRIPRTNLVWHRFEVMKAPTEANKVQEYKLVAEYRKCLELASQITPIDQSALKRQRFNALVNSIDELEHIVNDLQSTSDPSTLYFLWSQTGDNNARRRFLQMEGTTALDTAELQFALATFYTTRDQEKTITILDKALSLTQDGKVNPEILKSMASIHQGLNRKERAYIWTMVAKRFDVQVASEKNLKVMFNFSDASKYDVLDDIAGNVAKAIDKGRYHPSLIPTNLE
ncbi:conserved hypothetical protein [Vibrio rotiferianus]|nr:conserved hypothetical protein [Vibrio rotiferianus]CAH1573756.1 conserved hypothetical protein [Vibrio rotiferianus]